MRKQSMLSPSSDRAYCLHRQGSEAFHYSGEWSSVMNRLVAMLALAVALGGPASAQTFYRPSPDFRLPRIVGGEVDFNGAPVLGNNFSSRLLGPGEYEIDFRQGVFAGGCPVLNAVVLGGGRYPPTAEVDQPSTCSRTFYVYWFSAITNGYESTPFQFVAVGTSGR
jgi:hypothetical protein